MKELKDKNISYKIVEQKMFSFDWFVLFTFLRNTKLREKIFNREVYQGNFFWSFVILQNIYVLYFILFRLKTITSGINWYDFKLKRPQAQVKFVSFKTLKNGKKSIVGIFHEILHKLKIWMFRFTHYEENVFIKLVSFFECCSEPDRKVQPNLTWNGINK